MNIFFFEDRTGKHIRSHAKVASVIFAVIMALVTASMVNHDRMVSQVMATPRPLDPDLILTVPPQATPIFTGESCPSNPANWTLSNHPVVPTSNLKTLAPQCVYDSLEKTAAWVYATTVLGYTRADAAARLGLSSAGLIAYPANGQILVLTDFNEQPQPVSVVVAADNAQFAEWQVGADGVTGVALTFSGCFSTATFSGGQTQHWGSNPIICQFFADDRAQFIVSNANGHLYTGRRAGNVRYPLWFGYVGNGSWAWLGSGDAWAFDLSDASPQKTTLNTVIMAEKYGMPFVDLPQNWQSAVGMDLANALLVELNKK